MKIGISTWVYERMPIEDALTKLTNDGFRIVEVWGDMVQLDPRVFPENNLGKVVELGKSLQIEFHSLHSPFTNIDLGSASEIERENSVHWTIKALKYCRTLGCSYLVLHPGARTSMEISEDLGDIKSRIVDSLKAVSLIAEDYGIHLLLENMMQLELRRYGSRTQDLIEIIQEVDPDNLGVCIDTGHALISKLNVYDEVKNAGEFLRSIHANENDGTSDSHLVPLNIETIDWKLFLKKLSAIKYSGPFMVEVYGGESPSSVVNEVKLLPQKLGLLKS
jgi:sugar phosphate isomerase/epimerase